VSVHLAGLAHRVGPGTAASGVSSVALNVTVTDSTGSGFVTAYPAGKARPLASNLSYTTGCTGANLVVVPVGTGGVVDLYASTRTQLVADGRSSCPRTGSARSAEESRGGDRGSDEVVRPGVQQVHSGRGS
jgi:hypothetical protein